MNAFYKVSSIIALLILPSLTAAQTASFICISDASNSYGAKIKSRLTTFDLPEFYLRRFALKKIGEGWGEEWEFKSLSPTSPNINSLSWIPLTKQGLSFQEPHFYIKNGFHLQFQTRKKPIYFRMDEELGISEIRIHLSGECQQID